MRLLLLEAKLWLEFRVGSVVCRLLGEHLKSAYHEYYNEHGWWSGYVFCGRCGHKTPMKHSLAATPVDRLSMN